MGEKHGYLPFPKSFKTICIHHTKEPKRETCKETMAPIVTSNICRLESAGGPSVMDLCGLSKVAHEHKLMLAVDNTFLSPYLQRPAELGVDLVVNSVTKYMNGHSDVIMGVVCTSRDNLYERLKFIQQHFGHIPAPFDCYQVIRSLKTLPIRMMRHMSSGIKLAQYLENHPKIEKVLNPALPSHPQHDLFKSQACGHSGMLAVYLKGTDLDTTHKLIDSLKLFVHAVSLGGYESLVQMPTLLSHRDTPDKLKKISGITDNLIRVTTGLENIDDLIADWEQALDKI
ncbi:unnamed protein product [Acanthoscelides obtectus]|uniref:cystathionine gamma-lyase n=1 Tax=Acanthoscelides obtectus TaxID=200917 RepID=A0A9P0LZK6_ACAOB|nr:unnamed protein product [Acanthoscelides obtectus]CAK1648745.1 Cystathionine gamma-lyase [Acanthoscelides obtectus]